MQLPVEAYNSLIYFAESLLFRMNSDSKKWGAENFWGLSYDYDPQWILDDEQKAIQRELIDVCRTVIRPQAVSSIF